VVIPLQGHFSLIIAVVDGYATGNIYLDDGKNSNYLDGNFIYRNFAFHSDILYNKKGKKAFQE
jgi:hypothetical protein